MGSQFRIHFRSSLGMKCWVMRMSRTSCTEGYKEPLPTVRCGFVRTLKIGCVKSRTFVRSGGVIEGDFADDELKQAGGDDVSLKIAVGSEPYKVVEEAKRFYNSDCKHSPYDAIVNWATFFESNSVHVP